MIDKIKVGLYLHLEGVTLKGKNRINEHGAVWEILEIRGSEFLLRSVKTGYLKWGLSPDFKVYRDS